MQCCGVCGVARHCGIWCGWVCSGASLVVSAIGDLQQHPRRLWGKRVKGAGDNGGRALGEDLVNLAYGCLITAGRMWRAFLGGRLGGAWESKKRGGAPGGICSHLA